MLKLTHSTLPAVAPAFKNDSVNVCFATDQNYLPYLTVVLRSLAAHADPARFYDICILHDGTLDISRFPLRVLAHSHLSIRFVSLDLSQYDYDFAAHLTGYYTIATYYRFFIGEIFRHYRKILYLDSDIIILEDIAHLFDFDLQDKMLAAGNDRCHYDPSNQEMFTYVTQTLAMPFAAYFCCGVMLMDIAKMRAARLLLRSLQKLDELGHPKLVDQDVLNSLFYQQTTILPTPWNVMWSLFLQGDPKTAQTYRRAALPAKIIHYDSATKPWHAPNQFLADKWWFFAKQTPYFDSFMLDSKLSI